jgi:hypothetical protein
MKFDLAARHFVSLFILLAFMLVPWTGCALDRDPRSLTPVADGDRYELVDPYVFRAEVMGMQSEVTLAPGIYTAAFKDKGGEYLLVDDENFRLMLESKKPGNPPIHFHKFSVAGIYLPRDASLGARVFIVRPGEEDDLEKSRKTDEAIRQHFTRNNYNAPTIIGVPIANAIIRAIIKAGAGNFHFPKGFKSDAALRQLLVPPAPAEAGAMIPNH